MTTRVVIQSQSIRQSWLVAVAGAAFAVSLSGCPGGAELEHPETYAGSTSLGSGTGGTTGGAGGTAGTGAAGMPTGARTVPATVTCDYVGALSRTCALTGCHKPGAIPVASGLNLVAAGSGDAALVERLYNMPALHADIYCGDMPCATTPAECPVGDKLIAPGNAAASWLLVKMGDPMGCGDAMPPSVTFTQTDRDCLTNLVNAIAALP